MRICHLRIVFLGFSFQMKWLVLHLLCVFDSSGLGSSFMFYQVPLVQFWADKVFNKNILDLD